MHNVYVQAHVNLPAHSLFSDLENEPVIEKDKEKKGTTSQTLSSC